jgi:microcystin-dependent protein
MSDAPGNLERRDFLGRALAALSGVWLARGLASRRADAAPMQDQPYVGEIRTFAGNFAPVGWAFCDGALLPISGNDTLFQLIGTTYGGDGQSTFALPDLRGRAPVHAGTSWVLGQSGGVENVTLTANQIPAHTHSAAAYSLPGDASDPAGRVPARNAAGAPHYGSAINTTLAAGALQEAGGSQSHTNMQPYLAINFIISLFGVYPSQA